MNWAKIRSWHLITGVSRASRPLSVRCGNRWITPNAPQSIDLPLGEPSCETCTRLKIHDEELAARMA